MKKNNGEKQWRKTMEENNEEKQRRNNNEEKQWRNTMKKNN